MQTTINQPISATYTGVANRTNVFTKLMTYAKNQERNRLLWLGIILAAHGCILTPLTVMATFAAGANFTLFMTAMVAMGIALVTNLAAMPTKVTIPAFVLSILMDITIIVSSVVLAAS